MDIGKLLRISTVCVGLVANLACAGEPAFRFLAIGDLPYSEAEDIQLRKLLKQSEQEDFAFLIHVGDIKSGGDPCSDTLLENMRELFQNYPKPVVYSIGDNEWTDCRSTGGNPIEQLAKLRRRFFQDRDVLRLQELQTKHQSDCAQFTPYVENYRFTKSGVLFVVIHVCGSSNNKHTSDPASMKEFTARNAANMAFLEESFQRALEKQHASVVIVMHANPDFENRQADGFQETIALIQDFVAEYPGPVVCIHGDSHQHRIDQPLRNDGGEVCRNFTRMEVFGAPNVVGVAATVDPNDPEIFHFEPYTLPAAPDNKCVQEVCEPRRENCPGRAGRGRVQFPRLWKAPQRRTWQLLSSTAIQQRCPEIDGRQ